MTTPYRLSLYSAILISINIILGAGVFLNLVPLAQHMGSASPLVYVSVGLLVVPLIICFARLVRMFPSGTLYTFSREGLGAPAGFLVSWSYFLGKLASCSVMIHLFTSMVYQLTPELAPILPQLGLDLLILLSFTLLNLANMKTGNMIQIGFIVMKAIPILFVIVAGLFSLNLTNFNAATFRLVNTPLAFPLAIYAFTGFESIIALTSRLEDPERNGPKAIFAAFGAAIIITTLLQGAFYSVIDTSTINLAAPFNGISIFARQILGSAIGHSLIAALQLAVGCSALGGAYSILFSNNWNLFALAQARTLPFSDTLSQLNKYGIATWSVIAQALVTSGYLIFLGSQQVTLQQINALACTFAYTLSIVSYVVLCNKSRQEQAVGFAALITCLLFTGTCIMGFINKGLSGLAVYGTLVLIGLSIYLYRNKQGQRAEYASEKGSENL